LSTVGVLGDVARNVEDDLYPYCDGIMGLLINNLGSHEVHRSIKPQILSAFGDLALVLGDKYEKYLNNVKQLLQQAMQLSMAQASSRDEDFMDYNNELRIGILEAYSGIFQGLGPGEGRGAARGVGGRCWAGGAVLSGAGMCICPASARQGDQGARGWVELPVW
jgi:importin subunit beta-1